VELKKEVKNIKLNLTDLKDDSGTKESGELHIS
jgi:hypothetical protein